MDARPRCARRGALHLRIPPLHVVTNDEVLQRPAFVPMATEMLVTMQSNFALHIRGRLPGLALFDLVNSLAAKAAHVGTALIVNDRADVALAFDNTGVQLGARSVPVADVRTFFRRPRIIGYSAHSAMEAVQAEQDGADFILAGNIYETASHPGKAAGGLPLLNAVVASCSAPVLAIGGVDAERVAEVLRTGAFGVAVIRSVWDAKDPVQAANRLVSLMVE